MLVAFTIKSDTKLFETTETKSGDGLVEMPYLKIVAGPDSGRQHTLDSETAVLGRHPECDVVLESAAVSRQHAKIVRVDNVCFIEDLQSRNGTFVNGELTRGRRQLGDGDQLRICDLTLEFLEDHRVRSTVIPPDPTHGRALIVDDDEISGSGTNITSKLNVTTSPSGVQLSVKPEVKLKALFEISSNLSKTLKMDDVLPKLLDSLFKIFIQADRGFIVLKNDDGALVPRAIKHRLPGSEETVRISRTIIGQVMQSKEAILSRDAASDERFEMSQSIVNFPIRSVLCAPLVNSDGEALGVIQIDTLDQRSRFHDEDLEVLASVATQAAIAIDNAHLHQQALQQQQVLRDLELARKVQQSLLPSAPPTVEGYHFFDYYQSAREVGGDYYSYVDLPNGKLAVVLADVSGKGISAALLMAKLSSDVRYCLVSEPSPALAICRLNATMSAGGWEDRFVTLVLAVLDPRNHTATIVNAGHMAPLLRHGGQQVTEIAEQLAGLPLAVVDDYTYEESTISLAPGDFITLYTDGISEAMNASGDLYGMDRIRQQVGTPAGDVSQLGRHILDDVRTFVGDRAQSDDICLACFGRDGRMGRTDSG